MESWLILEDKSVYCSDACILNKNDRSALSQKIKQALANKEYNEVKCL
ncbi:hypothetical protein [Psychromonas antarctica]|nr:hypothetical protein [Psychromonas antarctica]MCG6200502.1 hypothetical protein [Psychromonas antarctica]